MFVKLLSKKGVRMMADRLTRPRSFSRRNVQQVPNQSGIYILESDSGVVQYVGMAKAGNLQKRLENHLTEDDIRSADKFSFRTTSSTIEAQKLERSYIDRLNPKQNEK